MTPTVLPLLRSSAVSRSTRVLLPAPGGPVTPMRYARPVFAKRLPTSSAAPGDSSSIREIARAIARGSRSRIRAASGSALTLLPPKQLPADDQPLDFAGALANRAELHVAEVLLRWVVLHEAVAAMDLNALFGDTDGNLARIELGNRRLERRPFDLAVAHPCGAVGEQARGLNPRHHVRDLPANRLELADSLAERAPLE